VVHVSSELIGVLLVGVVAVVGFTLQGYFAYRIFGILERIEGINAATLLEVRRVLERRQ